MLWQPRTLMVETFYTDRHLKYRQKKQSNIPFYPFYISLEMYLKCHLSIITRKTECHKVICFNFIDHITSCLTITHISVQSVSFFSLFLCVTYNILCKILKPQMSFFGHILFAPEYFRCTVHLFIAFVVYVMP